jgi:hypothetical protein
MVSTLSKRRQTFILLRHCQDLIIERRDLFFGQGY